MLSPPLRHKQTAMKLSGNWNGNLQETEHAKFTFQDKPGWTINYEYFIYFPIYVCSFLSLSLSTSRQYCWILIFGSGKTMCWLGWPIQYLIYIYCACKKNPKNNLILNTAQTQTPSNVFNALSALTVLKEPRKKQSFTEK